MKIFLMRYAYPAALAALIAGCTADTGAERAQALPEPKPEPTPVSDEFRDYWYAGKGELNRFELEQARYGEMHRGEAVLIFVTEDFLTDRQIKLESDPAGREYTSVLKMNFTKKFVTGLYPYSLMSSVFTPIDRATYPRSLKVSSSAQEWCGHVYGQINLVGMNRDSFAVEEHSYFEREGDRNYTLAGVLLEDEVWTRLRLAPERLPVGRIRAVPGMLSARLRHRQLAEEEATASMTSVTVPKFGEVGRYTLEYGGERSLAIDFIKRFPYEIVGWSETYADFGRTATTRAVRTDMLATDYWSKHSNADTLLRSRLGLDTHR